MLIAIIYVQKCRLANKNKNLKIETVFGEAETPIKILLIITFHWSRCKLCNLLIQYRSLAYIWLLALIWIENSCHIPNIWHRFDSQIERDSFMRQAPILSTYTPQTLYIIDHNNIYKNRQKPFAVALAHVIWCFCYEFIKSNLLNRTNSFKIASTCVNRTETHIFNIFIKGHGFRERKKQSTVNIKN